MMFGHEDELRLKIEKSQGKDPYIRNARILAVIDGDTIEVEIDLGFHMKMIERVRLLYVNAPEKKGATLAAGLKAKNFVSSWIGTDNPLCVIRTEKDDAFGRWLAEIWIVGIKQSLNDALIESGNAVPWDRRKIK